MFKLMCLIALSLSLSVFLTNLKSLNSMSSFQDENERMKYRNVDLNSNYDGLIVSFKRNHYYSLDQLLKTFDISSIEPMVNNRIHFEKTKEEAFCIRLKKQTNKLARRVINKLLDNPYVVWTSQ